MASVIQVFVTFPSRESAEKTIALLLERRLIACGQILGPVTSRYRWQGKVENAEEWLMVAKTTNRMWERLRQTLQDNHPYEVPEILAMPVILGLPAYLAWVEENTGGAP